MQPGRGNRTVIFSLEDGPATLDNQLYMYVGTKDRSAGRLGPGAGTGSSTARSMCSAPLDPARNSERTVTRAR